MHATPSTFSPIHLAGLRLLAAAALASCLLACQEAPSPPVGSLSAVPAELSLPHGSAADLSLRFEPTVAIDGEGLLLVFVHLVDAQGKVVLTADHALPGPWQPGQSIDDRFRLFHSALAPALPLGSYRLTAGLYRGEQRWSLLAGDEVARQEYQVARLEVPDAGGLKASFSPTWMPVSLGDDRQVVARRWLAADGAIDVEVPAAGGTLAFEIQIPAASAQQALVLAEGQTVPRVTVTSSCSPTPLTFEGSGRHAATLPLARSADPDAPTGGDGRCAVELAANYQLVDTQTFGKAILTLEQLAWQVEP